MEVSDLRKICEICQGDHDVKECQYYNEVIKYNEKEGRQLTKEEREELQTGVFMGVGLILVGFYFLWDISLMEAILAVMRDLFLILTEFIFEVFNGMWMILVDEELLVVDFEEHREPFVIGFDLQFLYFLFCFALGDTLLIIVINEWYKIKKGRTTKEIENYFG